MYKCIISISFSCDIDFTWKMLQLEWGEPWCAIFSLCKLWLFSSCCLFLVVCICCESQWAQCRYDMRQFLLWVHIFLHQKLSKPCFWLENVNPRMEFPPSILHSRPQLIHVVPHWVWYEQKSIFVFWKCSKLSFSWFELSIS